MGHNLITYILRKLNFVFLISRYLGSSLPLPPPPQPPQSHFINWPIENKYSFASCYISEGLMK